GNAEYTLTGVELTEERNEFTEKETAQVVKVSYIVKNNDDKDIPVGMDIEVYGSDNKKAQTYPNVNTMGSVASAKEMDCIY
ncbi:phage immunity protein, partial [Enterococcus faecalis]